MSEMHGSSHSASRRTAVGARFLWWVGPALLLSFAVTGCTQRDERPTVEYEQSRWAFGRTPGYRLESEHYEVFTTVEEKNLIGCIPDTLEAAYAYYQTLVPAERPPREKMKVYLFATRPQWAGFTEKFTGSKAKIFLQVRNGGYTEGGVAAIQYVSHQTTFPILTHEGFHQYLFNCVSADVPAWLNEGLATLCEGQRWAGWRLESFDADYNPSRENDLVEALLANRLFPLRVLLETNAGKVVQGTTRGVVTYYSQVWALMLFLREGAEGRYAPAFTRLLDDLGKPELEQKARAAFIWSEGKEYNVGEALFRAYISDDLNSFEQEFVAFMRARFLEHRR